MELLHLRVLLVFHDLPSSGPETPHPEVEEVSDVVGRPSVR